MEFLGFVQHGERLRELELLNRVLRGSGRRGAAEVAHRAAFSCIVHPHALVELTRVQIEELAVAVLLVILPLPLVSTCTFLVRF